jgi:hypothetical protein
MENGFTKLPAEDIPDGNAIPEIVDVDAQEVPADPVDQEAASQKNKTAKSPLQDAWKQVETIGQALNNALQERANVVMVRVNDEALKHLDMMVDADITKSRSESAAFLINEGIKSNDALFNRIREITDQIAQLKEQLREVVKPDISED